MSIKQYQPEICHERGAIMVETPDGGYVSFGDHIAALAQAYKDPAPKWFRDEEKDSWGDPRDY